MHARRLLHFSTSVLPSPAQQMGPPPKLICLGAGRANHNLQTVRPPNRSANILGVLPSLQPIRDQDLTEGGRSLRGREECHARARAPSSSSSSVECTRPNRFRPDGERWSGGNRKGCLHANGIKLDRCETSRLNDGLFFFLAFFTPVNCVKRGWLRLVVGV